MISKIRARKEKDRLDRADQLKAAIVALEQEIQQISAEGQVAPPECWLLRYQARGYKGTYWYYKLHAQKPIFRSDRGRGKKSRYKHLGKAGSAAHVAAALSLARRAKIDGLQRILNSLNEAWLDLCSEAVPKDDNSSREKKMRK